MPFAAVDLFWPAGQLDFGETLQADEIAAEIAKLMEDAAELKVPLKVDYALGANWDEAH